MIKKKINIFCAVLLALSFFVYWSNHTLKIKPIRAFYFWELNRWDLDQNELKTLEKNRVKKLYVKMFDVVKSETFGIVPGSKTELNLNIKEKIEIIPTIYIENEVFKNANKGQLLQFAENTLFLIQKRFKENNKDVLSVYHEIQIDCDWTESTKENYFYYLKQLKKRTTKKISATLRLYAYKFPEKMGKLPIHKAVLMCYNLLSPKESGDKNSILDVGELKKYLENAKIYPIPLDIALPIYSMIHLYHNGKFEKLVYLENEEIIEKLIFQRTNWYKVGTEFTINDTYFRKGDVLKYERISPSILNKSIDFIKNEVPFLNHPTIILFHLQSKELNRFNHAEINSIFYRFHN